MNDTDRIVFAVIVGTMVVLTLICVMGFLLVVNTHSRHRHRTELADADLRRRQEVMRAEREATEQTLREVGLELHDNVGQLLSFTQTGLIHALEERTDERLSAALDALDQSIEEVRRLGHSLNTDLWKHRSLIEAINTEAERIERVGRVRTSVVVNCSIPNLQPDTTTILYRAFQEIINNALKHSGADTLTVTLADDPRFSITIADNGRGFDPQSVKANNGLLNIHTRCALIGFEAQCTCSPGHGCTWRLTQLADHGT